MARVAGVAGVSPVRLFRPDAAGAWAELPGAGKAVTTFGLEAWQLPELLALQVVEGTDAPASPDAAGGDGTTGDTPTVWLPVLPDLC